MTNYELRFTTNTLTTTFPTEIVNKILGYVSHPIIQYLKDHEELANDKEKEKIDYLLGTPLFKIEHALYMKYFKKSTDKMYELKVYFKKQPKNAKCPHMWLRVCGNAGFVNVEVCNNHGFTNDECLYGDGIEEFYPIESKWGKKLMDTRVAKRDNPFLRKYENVSRLQKYIDNGIRIRESLSFGTDIGDMRYNIKREIRDIHIKGAGLIQEINRYGRHRLYHIWRHIQDGEVPPYNPRKHKNPNIIKKKK